EMRAFVACVLIAAVAAQPPLPTTTEKPRFFHALGQSLENTAHAVGTVEQELHVAEAFAADLGVDIRHLVENLMTGQLTSDQYLDSLPPLTERAHRLLSNFRTHVQHELQSLQGHKRQLDVLSTVSGVVQGLETQGQA
ncbi:hypothetical protein BaRGS_00024524, partial [Batillaria attramentaria]